MKASTLSLALCFLLVFASDNSVSSRRINPIFLGAPTPPPPSCHNANATAATASSLSSSKFTDAATLLSSSSNKTVVSTPAPLSSHKVSVVLTPPQSTQNAIAASAPPSPRRNFMQHSHASRAKRIIMWVILIITVGVFLVILHLFCAALCYKFGNDLPIWL
ncbi:hypothetical protein AAC387_Pa08g0093 [Persea americana]